MLKPLKCLYIQHFSGFSTFKISCFPIKIQSKTHAFSNASFRTSFFEILMRLDAKKLDFGSPLAPSWSQNGAQNRPSGAKKGPESIIPRTILRHWKRALKKHNMLAFFTALFPSSLSERSFIQKYYANAFGKPLNPQKKTNPNIQRLNETMTIFSKTSSAIHRT